MRQQQLPLRLPADLQVRAVLASQMWCEALRCSMSRERCVAHQTEVPRRTAVSGVVKRPLVIPPQCRSGQCRQGIAVLLEAGILRRAKCPTCCGCGWVPAER